MSELTIKKPTKAISHKWNTVQKLGFWFLLTALSMFWSGVYLGSVSATNTINDRESAKVQAVEDYKASLKAEQ